jgi:predicted PurR-regulated permease PerM
VLIGLLGGVQAFGVSGLLLGPIFINVAAALLTAPRTNHEEVNSRRSEQTVRRNAWAVREWTT